MKKLSVLLMFVAFGMLLSTSCKKDTTYADPTISFQGGNTSLTFTGSESVDVVIDFAAEGKIESIMMKQPSSTGFTNVDITKKTGSSYTTNANGETAASYRFKLSSTQIDSFFTVTGGTTLTFTFTLLDQEAKETSASYKVTKTAATTPLSVSKAGSFYHISGLNPGAWDLDGDAAVTISGTASAKSMKNTDAAGVTFTGSWTSDAANGTMYVKSNSFDFANATEEAAMAAYAAGTGSASVANPAVGDIYIGKKGTTYYAIKITNFDTTSKGNLGKISFDYKKK